MRTGVNIGGCQVMTLKGALLVYQGGSSTFVTWHQARKVDDGGAPYLGEAEPLTTDFLRALSSGLGTHLAPEILPPTVLVRTPETLIWWTPAQHRTMFFTANTVEGQELNGKRYPQPPIVFKVSGNELSVRALPKNERPTSETRLKTAPYWNTGEDGCVCVGTMRTPDVEGVESIEIWERSFFQSEFTHAYGAARLTRYPGGFVALWKRLAGGAELFPSEYLTDARETLREFAERR